MALTEGSVAWAAWGWAVAFGPAGGCALPEGELLGLVGGGGCGAQGN